MAVWPVLCGKTLCGLIYTVWVDILSLVFSLSGSRPSKRRHHRVLPPHDIGRVFLARILFPFSLPLIGPAEIYSRPSCYGKSQTSW